MFKAKHAEFAFAKLLKLSEYSANLSVSQLPKIAAMWKENDYRMKLSAMCIRCLVDRQEEKIREIPDEAKKSEYLKRVLKIIGDSGEEASAPYLVYEINKVHKHYFETEISYEKEKQEFNTLMLELEQEMEESIRLGKSGEEVLCNGIKYARAGNYIDFGAMNHVDQEQLLELLHKAGEEEVDKYTFELLKKDLGKAKELVYITDNCGEIVADKLLIKILKEQYPNINITVIVRGMPVLNDATMEDARAVGLTEIATVIGNGNGVGGTQMNLLSEEAERVCEAADLLIAKGQGNFETMHGCGKNIYYLFLCKCQWFSERFGMERLKGVFINERDVEV